MSSRLTASAVCGSASARRVVRSAAMRWAEGRERVVVRTAHESSAEHTKKEVPTLRAFAPRFIDGHASANRQKPSGIAAKEMILRVYLLPMLGHGGSTRSRTKTCSG